MHARPLSRRPSRGRIDHLPPAAPADPTSHVDVLDHADVVRLESGLGRAMRADPQLRELLAYARGHHDGRTDGQTPRTESGWSDLQEIAHLTAPRVSGADHA